MADDSQGLLGEIGQGLSKALPYALGAGIGLASGGGALGALAGAAAAQPDPEVEMKRQELAMEWQKLQIESKQAQMSLGREQSWNDYVKTLPEADQAIAREDPQSYIANTLQQKNWALTKKTFQNDPEFKAQNGGKDLDTILNLPPSVGGPILAKYMEARASKQFPGGVKTRLNPDGTTTMIGIDANGNGVPIPGGEGVSPKLIKGANEGASKIKVYGPGGSVKMVDLPAGETYTPAAGESLTAPGKPISPATLETLATKAYTDATNTTKTGYFGTTYGASAADRKANAMGAYVQQLIAAGVDPDKAQEYADKYVAPKFPRELKAKSGAAPAAASARAVPKNLWGKKGIVGPDGKKWNIDKFGKPTLAS
jgi:hypothetical protein